MLWHRTWCSRQVLINSRFPGEFKITVASSSNTMPAEAQIANLAGGNQLFTGQPRLLMQRRAARKVCKNKKESKLGSKFSGKQLTARAVQSAVAEKQQGQCTSKRIFCKVRCTWGSTKGSTKGSGLLPGLPSLHQRKQWLPPPSLR